MAPSEAHTVVVEILTTVLTASADLVTPDATLSYDLEADSLDVAEIAVALQQRGIPVTKDEVKEAITVADLIHLVAVQPQPAS